jgi:hypothetical protein
VLVNGPKSHLPCAPLLAAVPAPARSAAGARPGAEREAGVPAPEDAVNATNARAASGGAS